MTPLTRPSRRPLPGCRLANRLVFGLALIGSAELSGAGDTPHSALAKLRQTGEVSCQPSLPFFCSNMHVSCSGQTAIAAFPFTLRATDTQGSIEAAPETEGMRMAYQGGRVEWDGEGAYVIVRPRLSGGYVKLLADGTYSFRHYAQHLGVMSIGRCD